MRASKDLKKAFDTLWNESVEILPTLLIGILILVGGWIVAKLISKLILKLLEKSQNSKLTKFFSMATFNEKYSLEINLPKIVSKVVYWVIFLFFIVAASETFGWSNVSKEISVFIHFIPRLLSALLIFALGYTIAGFIRDAIKGAAKSMAMPIGSILANVLFYFLLLVVSLTALSQAGVDIAVISSQMYIIIGALALTFSIAFGWGAKSVAADLLKNYYNRGVLNQGDKIEYKNIIGVVSKISKTSVVIDVNKEFHVIPSRDFYSASYKIIEKA